MEATFRALTSAEDDEGQAGYHDYGSIEAEENVYSFFQYLVPSEKKKENKGVTIDIIVSYFLVILCVFMQLLALYAIFLSVVVKDVRWSNKVMAFGGKSWGLLAPAEECNDGSSLCRITDGIYTCAPPSVQLTGRWDELDTDGDGAWSMEEAEKNRDTLKCKYAVDPVEVFDVFKNIILTREGLIWIHPDVRAGKKIFKPYFDYLKGDVIMCGYGNVDMCPNLLDRGFFDAPLVLGTSPRVGNTTETALAYCKGLLEQQGTCETLLPSTYAVWKIEGVEQCGDPDYDSTVFEHPVTHKTKSMLTVDYDARKDYEKFQTVLYVMYKYVILCVWGLVMMSEMKVLVNMFFWVMRFPSEEAAAKMQLPDPEPGAGIRIDGIDRCHRVTNGIITAIRVFVALMLIWIGTLFLLKSGDYVDLLFDAVAVVFVLEFGEILYTKAIRKPLQEQCAGCETMRIPGHPISEYLSHRPGLVDMLWLFALFIIVGIVLARYYSTTVIPVYDALQCTCLNIGHNCREAQTFTYDFWYGYWSEVVPNVLKEIDSMEASVAQAQPVKTILHHRHHHHHHVLLGSK